MSETNLIEAEGLSPQHERVPTVLVLDTSGSMQSEVYDEDGETRSRIDQLNTGIKQFKDEVSAMEGVSRTVDVAVIDFGNGVDVVDDFGELTEWEPPKLTAGGRTPMGEAITAAIDLVDERKADYKQSGIPYKRPLIWILTDGKPTDIDPGGDDWQKTVSGLKTGEANNKFAAFLVTIGDDADSEVANKLYNKRHIDMDSGTFESSFEILSNSIKETHDSEQSEDADIPESDDASGEPIDGDEIVEDVSDDDEDDGDDEDIFQV